MANKAAMIIAHPGHELRVHHWLEAAKPVVFVLTDGSGRVNQSRLGSTTEILERAGATAGSVYGRFTDASIYAAILQGRAAAFISVLEELAEALVAAEIDYVAGDALEGYNPSHDVCRYLIGGAVELAHQRSGRKIRNYDFLLTGRPDECPESLRKDAISLSLDAAAIDRKVAAAEGYPELKHEVEGAIKQFGKGLFSTEWLRPVSNRIEWSAISSELPFFETYGEKKKAAGEYKDVIRQREHLQPLVTSIWKYIEGKSS